MHGKANAAAMQTQTPVLVTSDGTEFTAIGYLRHTAGQLEIHIERQMGVRSLVKLKVKELGKDDQLWLIFQVTRGTTITSFEIGGTSKSQSQTLRLQVP